MKNNTQTLQETIRAQAYLLSEREGHPPGKDKFFWFQAEAIMLEQGAVSSGGNGSSKNGSRKAKVKSEVNRARSQIQKKKARGGKTLAAK